MRYNVTMNRLKKIFISLIICSLFVTGCGEKTADEAVPSETQTEPEALQMQTARENDGRTVVGISMPDKLLERWNRDGAFLKEQFENSGCEVILKYSDNLIDKQITGLEEMIEKGADLLVVAAVDGSALSGTLETAHENGVKVIAYDRLLMDTDAVDYYVSFDNYKVGYLQASYIVSSLGLKTSEQPKYIEFVTGDPVDNNARFFYNGAMDTLKPYLDSGKLVVASGQTGFYETSTAQWSSDIAQQRIQIILNSYYPDGARLDAVLCANDSTALGVKRALETDYTGKNNVVLTGQDADIANIYNILDHTQSMTVFKALDQEAVVTEVLAKSVLSGTTPGEDLIKEADWDFTCTYNTTDYNNGVKVVPSYLLRPVAVTYDNLEKELFDTGYYARNSSGLIYSVKSDTPDQSVDDD